MFLGFESQHMIARYIGESKVGMETDAFAIADCMGSANSVCVPACHGHQKMLETIGKIPNFDVSFRYIKPDIQTIAIGQAITQVTQIIKQDDQEYENVL